MSAPKTVIVEDDHDLQFMYKLKLKRVGFEVSVANNGKEGLETIEKTRPDIVLLDLMMPVMSGTEMLAHMRQHEWAANIRVVVLTNISKTEAPSSLRFLHVDRYLVKAHYTPTQVVSIIQEVMENGVKE